MPHKKIVYVITKASWGGAQKYVYELAVAARTAGHNVCVAYGEGGELAERLMKEGIRTVQIHGLTRDVHAKSETSVYGALYRFLKEERPDIAHLNSAKAGGLGALAARMAGVKNIIFTAHGWAFNEERPWWQRLFIRVLSTLTVMLSHKTICVSEAVRRDIASPLTNRKLVVIKNGIRTEALLSRIEARRVLGPSVDTPCWVGMLSELHPTKRVEDALQAIKDVPGAHLFVLGEGQSRDKLEALISSLHLSDRVHLLGFVKDAPKYLNAFDIFVHASRSEALSLAILEAGQAGLPVVATKVGGIPEIIEDGASGLLVPPYAPHKLAAAITDLVEHPEKAGSFGRALQERVTREFSLEKTLKETLALY